MIRYLAGASLSLCLACGDSASTSDAESDGVAQQEFPGGPCEDAGPCVEGEVCVKVKVWEGCSSNTGGPCPDDIQCKTVPDKCYSESGEDLAQCLYPLCSGCEPRSYSGGVVSCEFHSGCV